MGDVVRSIYPKRNENGAIMYAVVIPVSSKGNGVLLRKRSEQPYAGRYDFLSDTVREGEIVYSDTVEEIITSNLSIEYESKRLRFLAKIELPKIEVPGIGVIPHRELNVYYYLLRDQGMSLRNDVEWQQSIKWLSRVSEPNGNEFVNFGLEIRYLLGLLDNTLRRNPIDGNMDESIVTEHFEFSDYKADTEDKVSQAMFLKYGCKHCGGQRLSTGICIQCGARS